MSHRQIITDLLGLQGWEVVDNGIRLEGDSVVVSIRRRPGSGYRCRGCGQMFLFCHDHLETRRVRDFPVWGRRCYLEFTEARVHCPQCGVLVEALDWLDAQQRQTLRYERYVARLCDILPALDVAELDGLDKGTVYRIDRKWLTLREKARTSRPVRYLGIDEIALHKGHRYATVFYDLERREVIGMVKGRKQRQVSGFFRRWGKEACRRVTAVCMDLWSAYLNSVRRYCRNAAVVFDKFHVYSYLSAAVDQVRRDEQNRASEEGKRVIKGTRWLWLKRSDRLRRKDKQTLNEIMSLNQNLQKAYLLKEDFQRFYACTNRLAAEAFLQEWTQRCHESALQPFRKLARRLRRWAEGILAYFHYRITNAISEGINNKIKVLKRRSYGFHDDQYFFLKILNATRALPSMQAFIHNF
jgi:transposase